MQMLPIYTILLGRLVLAGVLITERLRVVKNTFHLHRRRRHRRAAEARK